MVIALKNNIQDVVFQDLTLKNQGIILLLTRAYLGYLSEFGKFNRKATFKGLKISEYGEKRLG